MKRWNHSLVVGLLVAGMFGTSVGAQAPKAVELGSIDFPTSAKPAAQAPFLTGTKALYNFEFDIAGDAFRESQKADPDFALAYWGEAMSYNHPLWAEQDQAAARKVLERLAPTAAARYRERKVPSGTKTDRHDTWALADALRRLLADASLRTRLGEAGRQRVRVEFEESVMIARYGRLFESLLGKKALA